MKQRQDKSQSKSIYYSDDFSQLHEVPDDRLTFRDTTTSTAASTRVKEEVNESSEREVMMAPNNIEFFYAAEERSERIWRIDEHLNRIWRWLVRVVSVASFIAIGLHLKSRVDMRNAASKVVVEIEKEGAKA